MNTFQIILLIFVFTCLSVPLLFLIGTMIYYILDELPAFIEKVDKTKQFFKNRKEKKNRE